MVSTADPLSITPAALNIRRLGTLRGAQRIADEADRRGLTLSVIGVPKTIDNDIPYIDQSVDVGARGDGPAGALQLTGPGADMTAPPGARAREGAVMSGAQAASRRKAHHGSSRTVFHEGSV